ncbi:MAG: acetyltransferase [Alistipes sp.]|nr:acetyltransferase [Alistipes sp.]
MRNDYSLLQKVQLAIYLFVTKLICRKARLFRLPIDLRGRKYIDFGYSLTTGVGCRFEAFVTDEQKRKKIIFGKNVQVNDYVHISAMDSVVIGDNVLMASHVYISDNSHGFYGGGENDSSPLTPPKDRPYMIAPVKIGENTWIGEGVIVMPGVEIGSGCVIGAHSIVNKSIPNNCIAVGSPAKVVKKYSQESQKWEKIISA